MSRHCAVFKKQWTCAWTKGESLKKMKESHLIYYRELCKNATTPVYVFHHLRGTHMRKCNCVIFFGCCSFKAALRTCLSIVMFMLFWQITTDKNRNEIQTMLKSKPCATYAHTKKSHTQISHPSTAAMYYCGFVFHSQLFSLPLRYSHFVHWMRAYNATLHFIFK